MSNGYLDLLAYFGIGGSHPGGFALTQSIVADEVIQPFESVLDIGCGTGQTAAFIDHRFKCQVTAIDNHPIMLEKARERFKNSESRVKVIEGDAQHLDLEDNSFDLIIAESVITFTDISKTLHELSRVLKSDGRMIIIEMTAEQLLPKALRKKIVDLYGIVEILNEEQWTLKLRQAGFTRIDMINTSNELIPNEINNRNQSENIDIKFFDLWDEHTNLIKESSPFIGFRAFRCHLT
jgi:ubiquinone/menaquinone biosynthesis C-methylase UbiE